MKTVRFKTLGCRLNIAESDALAGRFRELGFELVDYNRTGSADVTVVNTCTVTDKADSKNRYQIRKSRRESEGLLVVTGCYAHTDRDEVAALTGVDLVVDNSHKGKLPDLIAELVAGRSDLTSIRNQASDYAAAESAPVDHNQWNFGLSLPQGHTRGYLKVQDGCNKKCAYCKIPAARGRATSADPQVVLSNYRSLNESGIEEAILSGINLGWYRFDARQNIKSLPRLLDLLLSQNLSTRLRISSIEPGDITARLLEVTTKHAHFTPFFHVPVQAGSDPVLKRMRRGYRASNFKRRVELIREMYAKAHFGESWGDGYDNPFISTDLIVGFPGESHSEFEESVSLLEDAKLASVHVFPFSKRSGTEAANFVAAFIDPETIRKRASKLQAINYTLQLNYYQSMVGRRQIGIFQPAGDDGYLLTENFLKVKLTQTQPLEKGKIYPLEILDIQAAKDNSNPREALKGLWAVGELADRS